MNKMVNSYYLFAKIVYILVFGGFVRAKKMHSALRKDMWSTIFCTNESVASITGVLVY